jgi:Outer membrane protein beta-barrel domain
MNLRRWIVLGCVLLFGTAAFAQDYPKVEVPVGYSYMRFNPEDSHVVSGFSLNGGGGAVIVNINHWIGIQGEFVGYANVGTKVFNFSGSTPLCPTGCTVRASGDLFTYNVGPVFKYRMEHVEPFVETMFGGAHSSVYGNLFKACQNVCQTTSSPTNNAWDFIIGGGLDVPLGHSISIRPAQFDYVLTRFHSAFTTSNQNQSNFRYQAGVVFRF